MLALRPCAAAPRTCRAVPPRRCSAARRPAPRVRRVRAAPEGSDGPQEPPKGASRLHESWRHGVQRADGSRAEPADDPTRPASVGRPAYDEDREAFYGTKPQGPREPPKPKDGRRYGDDGVSGGQYGYGKTVDTAFKYLAAEGTFLLGAVRPSELPGAPRPWQSV